MKKATVKYHHCCTKAHADTHKIQDYISTEQEQVHSGDYSITSSHITFGGVTTCCLVNENIIFYTQLGDIIAISWQN